MEKTTLDAQSSPHFQATKVIPTSAQNIVESVEAFHLVLNIIEHALL